MDIPPPTFSCIIEFSLLIDKYLVIWLPLLDAKMMLSLLMSKMENIFSTPKIEIQATKLKNFCVLETKVEKLRVLIGSYKLQKPTLWWLVGIFSNSVLYFYFCIIAFRLI